MITTVLASAAFVLALPGGSGGAPKPHCPAGLYSNLQCCTTDVLNVADLDCSPCKFSLSLIIEEDRSSTLLYLQTLSMAHVPTLAQRLCAASFQWYVTFI